MDFFIAVVALIGFAAIVAFGAGALIALYEEWTGAGSDSVDPYQGALDATARISAMAFEAERAMYEAARQAKHEEAGDSGHLPIKLKGSDDPRLRGGGDRQ